MSKLTQKQEVFVIHYLATGNATEAYYEAYNVKKMSYEAVRVEAFKLLQHPNISQRVDTKREALATQGDVTREMVKELMLEDRKKAHDECQLSAATTSSANIAKLYGHMIEKKEVESNNRHDHTVTPISPFDGVLEDALGEGAESSSKDTLPN